MIFDKVVDKYDPLWCDHCGLRESEFLEYKKKEGGLKDGECPGCLLLTPEQIRQIENIEKMIFESVL